MSEVKFACFVENEFQLMASLFALRSLQVVDEKEREVILMVPKEVRDEVEGKTPGLKLNNLVRKLGGQFKETFGGGFNPRNALRVAFTHMGRMIGEAPVIYFAPTVIFFKSPEALFSQKGLEVASAPDDLWPELELYGPKLDEIWRSVVEDAGADPKDWFDKKEPVNYWRHYPAATTRLFYAPNAKAFADAYKETSIALIEKNLPDLVGQKRDLVEATIAQLLIKEKGKLASVDWARDVITYDGFAEIALRLDDAQFTAFGEELLEHPPLRQIFKRNPELRVYFYHPKLRKTYAAFDEIEKSFTMKRMQQLIERRKIDKKLRGLVKKAKEKAAQDAQSQSAEITGEAPIN